MLCIRVLEAVSLDYIDYVWLLFSLQARKAIALRSTMEKKLANVEREKKEDNLRQLAQKARDSRVGLRAPAPEGENSTHLF